MEASKRARAAVAAARSRAAKNRTAPEAVPGVIVPEGR